MARTKLECDLVMRGGITSGIVYPKAIAELAKCYRFRSIGGTSAGAIAATVTAAAAHGARQASSKDDPFESLIANLPETLSSRPGGKTVLHRLFQPEKKLRRLFHVCMAALGPGPGWRKSIRIIATIWMRYWMFALLGVAIALSPLLYLWVIDGIKGTVGGLVVGLALLVAFLLGTVAASAGIVWDVLKRLPLNKYGMCSGSNRRGEPDSAGVLPLTDWLHELIQKAANKPLSEPLTFGELWNKSRSSTGKRNVELVLMTTDITRGISRRLPFMEGKTEQLFFNEEEFRDLFPSSVVDAMKEKERPYSDQIFKPDGFHRWPAAGDIPILVGARMSLSFPFLLSAVPVHVPDPDPKASNVEGEGRGKMPLRRCWFSDGGLTSNFPIHFFDAPLPSRPTFGINLIAENVTAIEYNKHLGLNAVRGGEAPETDREEAAWNMIWMPDRNRDDAGEMARFNLFDLKRGSVPGFFSAMFDTARNWGDTELMALPSYRDRIAHVKLAEHEGGMNLDMPSEVIERVGKRGELAGRLLAARFAADQRPDPQTGRAIELDWDNHRWVRFRAFMAALETGVRKMQKRWSAPGGKAWRSYEALLDRADNERPMDYRFRNASQQQFARQITKDIIHFVAGLNKRFQTFDSWGPQPKGGAPRPKPVLRLMPAGHDDPKNESA